MGHNGGPSLDDDEDCDGIPDALDSDSSENMTSHISACQDSSDIIGCALETVAGTVIAGNSGGTYPNQMADNYAYELADADNAFSISSANGGISGPASVDSPEFNQILAEAAESGELIKFTVNPDGSFVISPHTVGGIEINHSVLANGGGVEAAGEAYVFSDGAGGYLIDGENHSGHYQPPASSAVTQQTHLIMLVFKDK